MSLVHIRPLLFANDTMNIVCKLFNTAHILGIHSGGQVERPTSPAVGQSCGELLLRKCGFLPSLESCACGCGQSPRCRTQEIERAKGNRRWRALFLPGHRRVFRSLCLADLAHLAEGQKKACESDGDQPKRAGFRNSGGRGDRAAASSASSSTYLAASVDDVGIQRH